MHILFLSRKYAQIIVVEIMFLKQRKLRLQYTSAARAVPTNPVGKLSEV
jgi:hypothetical protein